ncbi:PQQ-dependent sugar dehydrogenase [Advenella sp. RU8]|uniref:PQQ-dependent sugar dehydrogenase n=1 Tax=Advenella sp. RU8 TaxID=3399575 RepID=UPI003AAF080A
MLRLLKKTGLALCLATTFLASPGLAQQSSPAKISVQVLENHLEYPWGMAFLANNQGILITERPGKLRLWTAKSGLSAPISGVPRVFNRGQGGLLDIALAPDFTTSRHVYLSFAEEGSTGRASTSVGYGRLSEDMKTLENFQVIFRQEPRLSTGIHFGSRLVFDDKGYLFIALGENNQRPTAQDLDKLQGKIVRLFPDGSIPKDNPFFNVPGVRPEIWSYGHRNQQGAALNPWTRQLWTHEHGPRGGDEINIPKPGKNYGWPIITHGINYSGTPIPEAAGTHAQGMEQPVYYWKVSPAISGMAFYDSNTFPEWKNSLFIGALVGQRLIRLVLDGNKITAEENLLEDRNERIRDVRVGPDGYVYVLTDSNRGKLLKISP